MRMFSTAQINRELDQLRAFLPYTIDMIVPIWWGISRNESESSRICCNGHRIDAIIQGESRSNPWRKWRMRDLHKAIVVSFLFPNANGWNIQVAHFLVMGRESGE